MTVYRAPGPVANAFLASKAPIRFIEGPVGSGKSSVCAMALYVQMCTMPKMRDGKRRSRWLVTRNTYPDLRGSTVETFLDWFKPEVYGKFRDTEPYSFWMKYRDVEAEVVFESFLDDRDEVIRSLRSKEFTGAWVNECQFMPRRLVFEIASRTGRYPRLIDIKQNLPPGQDKLSLWLVGDNNAPFTDDHWILRMRGDVPLPVDMPPEEARQFIKPPEVEFFKQPAALREIMAPDGQTVRGYEVNPEAENLENVGGGVLSTLEMERLAREAEIDGTQTPVAHRFIQLTSGRTKDEIDRDLLGRVVRVKSGAPATPQFRRERHVTREDAEPLENQPVIMGADHGLTPAIVFFQIINSCWIAFDELVGVNMGSDEFAPMVRQRLATRFPWIVEGRAGYTAWGDPQGGWRGSTDTRTPFQLYKAHGIEMRAPWAKDKPLVRLETNRRLLSTEFNGRPRLMVHPRCVRYISSLDGGAQVKRIKTPDGLKITEEIVKNAESHIWEAGTYALCGGGEAREMLTPAAGAKAKIQNTIPKKRRLITVGRGVWR